MALANKPVIAVDIDEVLALLHRPFLEHHNEMYGTEYVYPDAQDRYYLSQFTGEDLETSVAKIKAFVDHPSFADVVLPLPGATKAVAALSARYELVIITARQHFYKEVTNIFLQRYFPRYFREVFFIPETLAAALSPAEAKMKICGEVGASFLIDDNSSTSFAAAKKGIAAVLFGDYHWNQTKELPVGVTRCKDWAAVLEYFDEQS